MNEQIIVRWVLAPALASVIVLGVGFGCSSEESTLASEQRPSEAAAPTALHTPPSPARVETKAELSPEQPQADPGEPLAPEAGDSVPLESEPESTPEDSDPLAPILPSGPAPGSPEADAELKALLEESTLTQEEFDQAFRGGGPKIDGDQLVFGPNERSRKLPLVEIGEPKVSGSSIAASTLGALAKADLRKFEGCYAMALGKDPTASGSGVLHLEFDGSGEVSSAKLEDASAGHLGSSLSRCLSSVAEAWSLAGAAGASVEIPLSLSAK